MAMKDVPSKESIPSIFMLVTIAAITFFRTSMYDIIMLMRRMEYHYTL